MPIRRDAKSPPTKSKARKEGRGKYPPKKSKISAKSQQKMAEARSLTRRWTPIERSRLFEGLRKFGKDWNKVTAHVGGERDIASVRS